MEHRWGRRIDVSLPVRLRAPTELRESSAHLANLSVSGGWIPGDIGVRQWCKIQVAFDLPVTMSPGPHSVNAFVARQSPEGIGLEWCEHAPRVVTQLLHVLTSRSRPRLGVPIGFIQGSPLALEGRR